jgi:2-keto-4-pentenoate hydratase/2-oxohepta-3-ene-1,7-dioic acid hydratase in catechol pathway
MVRIGWNVKAVGGSVENRRLRRPPANIKFATTPIIRRRPTVKLVTFRQNDAVVLGALDATRGVLDLAKSAQAILGRELPGTMQGLIDGGAAALSLARETFAAAQTRTGATWLPLAGTRLAAPLPQPRKNVFCVGQNYKAHIAEMARAFGREVSYPKIPMFFSKPATTVVGQDDPVERHAKHTSKLDYEVELAVVIGARGRDIAEGEALSHVFGYTIVNDVTARDAQQAHGQFFKGKSFDTFCPMGPCIVTADEFGDPGGHRLALKVNGRIRQDSSTADLYFSVPQLIASLSAALTLDPGDVIATGTPSGVAQGMNPPEWLQVGDLVEAELEGIGVLRNRIVE